MLMGNVRQQDYQLYSVDYTIDKAERERDVQKIIKQRTKSGISVEINKKKQKMEQLRGKIKVK